MKRKNAFVACGRCKHYFVTFDRARPHGCKQFGFKSAHSPSLEVFGATGMKCALFIEKFPRSSRVRLKKVRNQ